MFAVELGLNPAFTEKSQNPPGLKLNTSECGLKCVSCIKCLIFSRVSSLKIV